MNILKLSIISLLLVIFSFAAPYNLSISIESGANYTGSTLVTLTLYAENATNCTYTNQGTNYTTWEAYTTSKSWTIPSTEGSVTVLYKCVDNNGTESSEVNDTIVLDQNSPIISLVTPGLWATSKKPQIKLSLNDTGAGINSSSIDFKLDSASINGTWDGTHLTYTPSTDLNLTSHVIEISTNDNFGRSVSQTWNFSIDGIAPQVYGFSPKDGSFMKTATPTIYATLLDNESGLNVSILAFTLDGTSVAEHATFDNATGRFTYTPGSSLSDGSHLVGITAFDLAGNSYAVTWNFSIDRDAPTISNMYPAKGATYTKPIKNLTATVLDTSSGVNKSGIEVLIDSTTYKGAFYNPDNGYLMLPLSISLSPGVHIAEIIATDNMGNSKYETWSFTLDLKGPSFTSISPADGAYINQSKPAITVSMKDLGTSGLDLTTTELIVDASVKTSLSSVTSDKISYTPAYALSEGNHTLKVSIANKDGSQASKSWTFIVDTLPPTVPSSFAVSTNNKTFDLSWKAPSSDVKNYLLYSASDSTFKSLTLLKTLDSSTLSHSVTTGKKTHFALSAKDSAGNEGNKVFIGTCGKWNMYGSWEDYLCCSDADCLQGKNGTCNINTHTCSYPTAIVPKRNATEVNAEKAINATIAAINLAKNQSKNISEADGILNQAQNAFNVGNYDQAKYLAEYALTKISNVSITASKPTNPLPPKKGFLCCPASMILILLSFLFLKVGGEKNGKMFWMSRSKRNKERTYE